mmetsp:Transcript_30984/g.30446  ORF Transcript_30984/g.30446 Transcript_30984/m.30446 type:complete len:141 (+) Transcript_30984:237-659(+)
MERGSRINEIYQFEKRKELVLKVSSHVHKKLKERFNHIIQSFLKKYGQAMKAKYSIQEGNPRENEEGPKKRELPEEEDDTVRCCICYESNNLYVSKCKHVACLNCWNLWLEKTLECPTCRNRTRKNQIFPMNKEDEQEII